MALMRRFSRTILTSLFITTPLLDQNSAYGSNSPTLRGAYVGIGVGVARINTKANATSLGNANDLLSHILHGSGMEGSLYGGYGVLFNGFYYGLEGGFSFSNVGGKFSSSTTRAKSNKPHSFKFGVRGGIPLAGGLLYAKVGLESARWRFSFVRDISIANFNVNAKKASQLIGFAPGIGVEIPVMPSHPLLLRVEYNYAQYPSKRLDITATSATNYQGTVTFKPATHAFGLGITYKSR